MLFGRKYIDVFNRMKSTVYVLWNSFFKKILTQNTGSFNMNESAVSREKQDLFLKNLRQQTEESHLRLEENKYSKALLEPSVARADYRDYIARLYGVTKACENDIFPLIHFALTDVNERYKSGMILEDLKKTGVSEDEISNLPVYKFNPTDTAEALGIMYVLEGSTLGGKILYKHVNQYLGIDAETGASYFYGYGQKTGILWKNFITALADYAVKENCEQKITSSAISAFTAIGNWLNEAEINWVK
jgi:heme oxygenase